MLKGYGPAIRVFTKISKVPVEHLKSLGHNSVLFVGDSYLQRETYQACLDNISNTIIEGTGLCYLNRKMSINP